MQKSALANVQVHTVSSLAKTYLWTFASPPSSEVGIESDSATQSETTGVPWPSSLPRSPAKLGNKEAVLFDTGFAHSLTSVSTHFTPVPSRGSGDTWQANFRPADTPWVIQRSKRHSDRITWPRLFSLRAQHPPDFHTTFRSIVKDPAGFSPARINSFVHLSQVSVKSLFGGR